MSRVLTLRTGRYGELRLVKKYEGESWRCEGVAAEKLPIPHPVPGGGFVDGYWLLVSSPSTGTGCAKRFMLLGGIVPIGVTG
jgi:hypothetical protein